MLGYLLFVVYVGGLLVLLAYILTLLTMSYPSYSCLLFLPVVVGILNEPTYISQQSWS